MTTRPYAVPAMVVFLVLTGVAAFAVSYRSRPQAATIQPGQPAPGDAHPAITELISVTGGHFDAPVTETVDDIVAFPAGKVPRLAGVPRTCSALRRVLRSRGGFDSGTSFVRVAIKAKLPVDVQIKRLRPRLSGVRTPAHIVPVTCVPARGRAGAELPENVSLPLTDDSWPTDIPQEWLQRTPRAGSEFRLARGGSISLQAGQTAEIETLASQGDGEMDWELVIDLLVNGERGQVVARDGTEPFHYAPNSAETGPVWCEASDRLERCD